MKAALARDQLGEYQSQAAVAALHADAPRFGETDWVQIVEWYDELLRFADTPIVRLNRAVAVGEAYGALAGLVALAEVEEHIPRCDVVAYLHEKNGDLEFVPASTPTQHATHRTSQNATTKRDRQRDSTSCFAMSDDCSAVARAAQPLDGGLLGWRACIRRRLSHNPGSGDALHVDRCTRAPTTLGDFGVPFLAWDLAVPSGCPVIPRRATVRRTCTAVPCTAGRNSRSPRSGARNATDRSRSSRSRPPDRKLRGQE